MLSKTLRYILLAAVPVRGLRGCLAGLVRVLGDCLRSTEEVETPRITPPKRKMMFMLSNLGGTNEEATFENSFETPVAKKPRLTDPFGSVRKLEEGGEALYSGPLRSKRSDHGFKRILTV